MSVLAGVEPILDQLFDEIDLEKEFLDFFREHHRHFAEGHAATGGELSDDDLNLRAATVSAASSHDSARELRVRIFLYEHIVVYG